MTVRVKSCFVKYFCNLAVIKCGASQPEAHTVTRNILVSTLAAGIVCAMSTTAHAQSARDSINIVGSSTVYPFTTTVAEQFGRAGKFKTPKVESTGTGGGIKLFCNGVGPQFPDIANASRRIRVGGARRPAQKNGVKDVVEIKVGYDGIVLAQSKAGAVAEPHAQGRLPGAGEDHAGSGQSDLADSESVHHVEGRQQVAARGEDRSARVRRRPPARAIRSPSSTWKPAVATSPGSTRCVPRTSRASSAPATAFAKTARTSKPAKTTISSCRS